MLTAISEVITNNSKQYMLQLCRHWAHKFKVSTNEDESGSIIYFNDNAFLNLKATEDLLRLELTSNDKDLSFYQEAVDKHILRFSFRENLTINWALQYNFI